VTRDLGWAHQWLHPFWVATGRPFDAPSGVIHVHKPQGSATVCGVPTPVSQVSPLTGFLRFRPLLFSVVVTTLSRPVSSISWLGSTACEAEVTGPRVVPRSWLGWIVPQGGPTLEGESKAGAAILSLAKLVKSEQVQGELRAPLAPQGALG